MLKRFLLLFQILFILGVTVSSVIPSLSSESFNSPSVKCAKVISPRKHVQSFKAIEAKSEKTFSELTFRDHFRSKFLKLIPLTLGFVCFCTSAESNPFSKQLSYGVLFSESYLKLFNDPSSHPLSPQGPPVV